MALRVSDLAAKAGVSPDTVRYYERLGLIPAAPRSASGYREYDEALADRLRFIKGAQSLGLRLSEIGELLEIGDRGACACGHTRALLRRRVTQIEGEVERLEGLRRELIEMSEMDCPPNESSLWPCEKVFIERGGV